MQALDGFLEFCGVVHEAIYSHHLAFIVYEGMEHSAKPARLFPGCLDAAFHFHLVAEQCFFPRESHNFAIIRMGPAHTGDWHFNVQRTDIPRARTDIYQLIILHIHRPQYLWKIGQQIANLPLQFLGPVLFDLRQGHCRMPVAFKLEAHIAKQQFNQHFFE
ncbi:MAG: hypothetical protein B7X93_08530 [Hydrogenophilales bacterium 17-61-9]|nr:MAG: hypothetical protein B7X93_08530 [Hydrogenophilales bacterium 17-61-9]